MEAKITRLDEALATKVQTPVREIRIKDVREFVNNQARSFEELLLGSPERVKNEFQKRISGITLTPTVDERGPVYKVTGDVSLFSGSEGVVQTNQVHLVALHCNIPISIEVVSYRNRQKWAEDKAA